MAAYTATQTGVLSSLANWSPSGVPGSGDTITIPTGVTITVDVDTTIGTSPADTTTFVLTVSGATAKLVIAPGVTLTVNGNAYFNAGASNAIAHGLELGAGSTLLFGSNAVNWVYKLGQFNVIYARGTSGNNAAIRGQNSAAAMPVCTLNGTFAGGWDCQYCTFQYLGKSNGSVGGGAALNGFINSQFNSANILSFDNCTFDNCWQVYFNVGNTTGCTVSFTNNTFTNSLYGPSNQAFVLNGKAGATFTPNLFSGNRTDATWRMTFNSPGLLNCTGNYFGGNFNGTATTSWPDGRFASFSGNFVRSTLSNPGFNSNCSDCYFCMDTDAVNQGVMTGAAMGGDVVWDSSILDLTTNGASGGDALRPYSDGLTKVITGMADNGSGLIRVTAASHGLNTGDQVYVAATKGTTEANNANRANPTWIVTKVDANTFDLQGSTFVNAFISNTSFNYVCRVVTHLGITGAANNGSGLVRITTPTHAFSTGDTVTIAGVGGTAEANGTWTIAVVSTTQFDLVGSAFTNAYTSGGTVDRPVTSNTIKNWIMIPSAYGSVVGKLASFWGNLAYYNLSLEHNTYVSSPGGTGDDASYAELGVGVGESSVGAPGMIRSFRSNLGWTPQKTGSPAGMPNDPNAFPGALLIRWQAEIQDYAYAENCDYNWGYNLYSESGYGYVRNSAHRLTTLFSSGSPDVHGADGNPTYRGDPQFVDTSRNMATYDSARLGNTAAQGTWTSGNAYAAGDVVSLAQSGVYYGATVNYRCLAAHTAGSTTKPASGASWRTNWEFASLYRLREDLTRIPDLIGWVRDGYAPRNADTATAGHDGAAVGAVAYLAAATSVLFRRTFYRRAGSRGVQ